MKKTFTLFFITLLSVFAVHAADINYCLCATTTGGTKINSENQNVKKDLWDDQISYTPELSLTKGKKYTLVFKVKASEPCTVGFWPIWNASPNKNQWGGSNDVQYVKSSDVTTEWKSLRITFTADFDHDGLDFVFGGLNGSIYFDDFKLVESGVGVNIFTNGDFAANNTNGWSSKSAYNGTKISIADAQIGEPGYVPEPIIPDTWEFAEQGDPNFHVYLAFGQSNMEGNAQPEAVDKRNIPERFKMMAAVNFSSPSRTKGNWYSAMPPLCRQGTGLTPCDYFGRYLVENLPEEVEVGVINVAVGGARIELFMEEFKDEYIAGEADWFKGYCAQYDNDPLGRLIEMGKKAQEKGVIKGILLHQGESNNGQADWAEKVAKVYKRICYRLGLNPAEVPLLAGETLYQEMGGGCSWHNINALPHLKEHIPNSYVISAKDIPGNGVDAWHFSAAGYRELGKRYGQKMLEILNSQAAGINDNIVVPYRANDKTYDLSGREVTPDSHGIVISNGVKQFRK